MNKPKYHIDLPKGFRLTRDEFYIYNPVEEFTEELNLFYLKEDLLQVEFPSEQFTIDLGWYGNKSQNDGMFKVQLIKGINWDEPVAVVESKSSEEIYDKLLKVIAAVADDE